MKSKEILIEFYHKNFIYHIYTDFTFTWKSDKDLEGKCEWKLQGSTFYWRDLISLPHGNDVDRWTKYNDGEFGDISRLFDERCNKAILGYD